MLPKQPICIISIKKKVIDVKEKYPLITKQMDSLLNGYYNATKYLYYNNKKLPK